MDKSKLRQLLLEQLEQKINTCENKEMNQLIIDSTDDELSSILTDLWNNFESKDEYYEETAASFEAIKGRIRRTMFKLKLFRVAKYAAVILLPVLSALSTYVWFEQADYRSNNSNFSVHAPAGKSSEITLPDGTQVALNSLSTLSYCNDKESHIRKVTLRGEANFKVTKNPQMPFVVSTQCLDVEVLGTIFNVKTYETDEIHEVALLEGKVKLSIHNQSSKNGAVYLTPNEKAIYNRKTGKLTVESTDNIAETAWTKGALMFHTEPLSNIVRELERRYDVNIHMNCPSVVNDTFTGIFDNKTLLEVLHILKIHYGFNYSINENDVTISMSKDK